MDAIHGVGAGLPSIDAATTGDVGGGMGNRVNAVVMSVVLRADLAAIKASMQQEAGRSGVGRILNVTV